MLELEYVVVDRYVCSNYVLDVLLLKPLDIVLVHDFKSLLFND